MPDLIDQAKALTARYAPPPPDAQELPEAAPEGEISKGLRGGMASMGAQLNAAAANAGDAMGFHDFAAERYAAAEKKMQEAAQINSLRRTAHLKDVNSIGSAIDYGAGELGALLPSVGGGLAAGAVGGLVGGKRGALTAATAAFTPMEAGDIALRQREDPVAQQRTPQENALRAWGGGLASSAAMNVVPGAIGAKLVGRGAVEAGERTLRQSIAHNMGEAVLGQGLAGAGSEAGKQFLTNSEKPMDWGAVAETGLANAVMGAPLGAVGVAGDRVMAGRNMVGKAADAVTGAGKAVMDAGGKVVDAGGRVFGPAVDAASDLAGRAAEAAPGMARGAMGAATDVAGAARDAMGTAAEWGSKIAEHTAKATAPARQSINESVASARKTIDEVMAADDVPQAIKEQVKAAAQNAGNKANQAYLRGVAAVREEFAARRKAAAEADAARGVDTAKVMDDAVAPKDETAERLAAGEPLGDLNQYTQRKGQAFWDYAKEQGQAAAQWTKDRAREMYDNADIDPETRQRLDAALAEPGKATNQAWVAAKVMAGEAKDKFVKGVDDLAAKLDRFAAEQQAKASRKTPVTDVESKPSDGSKPRTRSQIDDAAANLDVSDATIKGEGNTKKSLVGTLRADQHEAPGVREEIVQTLMEYVPTVVRGDAHTINSLGTNVRRLIAAIKTGDLDVVEVAAQGMHRLLGKNAEAAVESVYKIVEGSNPRSSERFYSVLQSMRDEGRKRDSLRELVGKSLSEKYGRADVDAVTDGLIAWAEGNDGSHTKSPAEARYYHQSVHDAIARHFGDKADAIYKALARHAEENSVRTAMDADYAETEFSRLDKLGLDSDALGTDAAPRERDERLADVGLRDSPRHTMKFGGGRSNNLAIRDPAAYETQYGKTDSASHALMEKLQGRFPDAEVYFKADPEHPKGWGHIMVDNETPDALHLTDKHLDNSHLETKYTSSKNFRVEVGGKGGEKARLLDATKLVQQMRNVMWKYEKGTPGDERLNIARAWMAAYADLTQTYGEKPRLPQGDDTILKNGENPIRIRDLFGETVDKKGKLKVDQRKGLDTSADALARQAEGLRKELGLPGDYPLPEKATKGNAPEGADLKVWENLVDVNRRAESLRTRRDSQATMDEAGGGDSTGEQIRSASAELRKLQAARMELTKANPTHANKKIAELVNKLTSESAADVSQTSAQIRDLMGKVDHKGNTPRELSPDDVESLKAVDSKIEALGNRIEALHVRRALEDEFTPAGRGRTEVGLDENVHINQAVAGGAERAEGRSLSKAEQASIASARELAGRMTAARNNKIANGVGDRLKALLDNADVLTQKDVSRLGTVAEANVGKPNLSAIAEVVNTLHTKYESKFAREPRALERYPQNMDGTSATALTDGGQPRSRQLSALEQFAQKKALVSAAKMAGSNSPDVQAVGQKLTALMDNPKWLSKQDMERVVQFFGTRSAEKGTVRDLSAVVNELHAKYVEPHAQPGGTPDPKAQAAQAAAFKAASSSELEALAARRKDIAFQPLPARQRLDAAVHANDTALLKELRTSDNAGGVLRTADYLQREHPDSTAARVAAKRADELTQNPDVAYGRLTKRYSMERGNQDARSTAGDPADPVVRKAVEEHLTKVLGPSIKTHWQEMTHAGEFETTKAGDIIRLAVNALDPQGTAFHESMHAFAKHLRDMGATDVYRVLTEAASSKDVLRQMREHLKDEPAALKQLDNAEERVAYMYQLYAKGSLEAPKPATTMLGKVAEFIRSMLGLWSNDERALHIFEHFNSGEYAKNIGDRNALFRATMDQGRSRALETLKAAAEPFMRMGETVLATGDARVRDTGVAALSKVADLVKPRHTQEAGDPGFLTAARVERTQRMNRFINGVAGYDGKQVAEALKALQTGEKAASVEARTIQAVVKKTLRDAFNYLSEAGAPVSDRGADYFHRVWDTHAISTNQDKFLAMLRKYEDSGHLTTKPEELMRQMMANEGTEFQVDTRRPGMQGAKERKLDFIDGADAEPFLNKDLFQTMNSYITQATRRAEWARRFGADGEKLDALLKEAVADGASAKDIETTETYLKGVNGTLGDKINPTLRRMMGNAVVYQNVRLLPLAIFSSAVDPMGIVVRGGTMRDAWTAFKRGISEIPNNFRKYDGGKVDIETRLAETLGVIDNAALMHSLGALYTQGVVGDTARRVNDTFFRLNMMEQFNTSMRVGAMQAAFKFMQRHAEGESKHSPRYLAELGLKDGDIQLDKGLERIKLTEAEGLSAEQAARVTAAVNRWVDGAVLRPDAVDKPVWMNDPHFMLVSHLKQFTYSFQRTIMSRVLHEAKEGNYTPALALLSYVPVMIAADYMKGFIQGGGEQPEWKKDWGLGDYVWSGTQRAGLFGVNQFGLDLSADIRHSGAASGLIHLAGPTVEQLTDGLSVIGGRERFGDFTLHSMPANALYASAFQGGGRPDPMFAE